MSKTTPIYKPGTTLFAGSIGEGRDTTPAAPLTTPAPAAVDAPASGDLGSAVKKLAKLTPEQKLAAAEASLLNAIETLSTEEGFKKALDFAASIPGYSMGNTLMLMWEHMVRSLVDPQVPANPGYFMSFNRWKEHGRSVVKGAKGYPILAPNTVTSRYYIDRSGQQVVLGKGEKAPAGVQVHSRQWVKGFSVAYTFPQYLTDGDDVPELPRPQLLEGESLPGLQEVVADLITERGFTLEYVNRADDLVLAGGANGYTAYDAKRIVVCADLPSDFARDKTLIHEYGHLVMHGHDGEAHSEHSGLKEVQAEAAAYLTFKTLADIDTSAYSVPYTTGWLHSVQGDHATRMREAQRALNAVGTVAGFVTDAYNAKFGAVPDPVEE